MPFSLPPSLILLVISQLAKPLFIACRHLLPFLPCLVLWLFVGYDIFTSNCIVYDVDVDIDVAESLGCILDELLLFIFLLDRWCMTPDIYWHGGQDILTSKASASLF